MGETHILESRLKTLIQILEAQKRKRRELSALVTEQAGRIADLERQLENLKHQLDESGLAQRKLKRVAESRRVIKKKVGEALDRIDRLEGQLDDHEPE